MLKPIRNILGELSDFIYEHYVLSTILGALIVFAITITLLFGAISLAAQTCTNNPSEITWEGDLQMSDTRIVHCIATNDGLSCDWNHASGADQQ